MYAELRTVCPDFEERPVTGVSNLVSMVSVVLIIAYFAY